MKRRANCLLKFLIDDVHDQWIYSDKFDLIHTRIMNGSIRDWPKFFQESFEYVGICARYRSQR